MKILIPMKKLLFLLLLFAANTATAQQGLTVNLWPEGPKTSNGIPSDSATVTVFLPGQDVATGRAIVICPGGGYSHLAFEHEGTAWAPFFNSMGIAAIVVKYRMPHGVWTVPGEDAEAAIRLVRHNAARWNIDPRQVGIMGFSAGGHLASTVATHAKGESAPDFQILFYPVISMENGITHQGSRNNLLGKTPKQELVEYYSNERQVTATTPRAFLVLAHDDGAVPPSNAVGYYEALCRAGVSAALHIYPTGRHGFGIRQSFPWHLEMMTELRSWLHSF